MPIGLKGNSDGSGAVQIGGSDAISISTGLNTTFAGTITATGTVAGTTGTLYPLVSGTAVSATGTSIDFTGIPSWARRITVMFSGVSTNGSSSIQIQLGTSGGLQITSYAGSVSTASTAVSTANNSTGFRLIDVTAASVVLQGKSEVVLLGSNIWTQNSILGSSDAARTLFGGGSVTLSGTLDRVRITTVNGTDTFDAGTINILFE